MKTLLIIATILYIILSLATIILESLSDSEYKKEREKEEIQYKEYCKKREALIKLQMECR